MSSIPAGLTSPFIGPILLDIGIGKGREGATYRIMGHPHLVAKIYHSPPSPKTIKKLEAMIARPPVAPVAGGHQPVLAWPLALVYDRNRAVRGFLMPLVEATWSIDNLFFPARRDKLQTAVSARIGWHHLHVIARNLALIVNDCHQSGYVIGDLNNQNVRVYADGKVCLIDTDSFQVVDKSQNPPMVHHCEVVFLDYAAPELFGQDLSTFDRTPASDCHSLATLVFMLLQNGFHPFAAKTTADPPLDSAQVMQLRAFPYDANRINQSIAPYPDAPTFGRLHPRLRDHFLRTFTIGLDEPNRRTTANEWQQSLGIAKASLQRCARGHYYVGQPNAKCLQVVPVQGGGYCGSTELSKSSSPLPFQSIDAISGKVVAPSARQTASGPLIDLKTPAQPSPSQPAPPPPPTPPSSQVKSSRGDKFWPYLVVGAVALLLLIAYLVRPEDEPNRDSTVVASDYRTATARPARPIPTRTSIGAPSAIQADSPTSEATRVPPPKPTAPSTHEPNRGGPTKVSDATTVSSLPESASLQEILSQANHSNTIIYSSQSETGWELSLFFLGSNDPFPLQSEIALDPSPAMSPDGEQLAYLADSPSGFVVRVLNMISGVTNEITLPQSIGRPSNLAWKGPDNSVLVTATSIDEPQVSRVDLDSGETTPFLDPWSANPSVSQTGEMVYVVPVANNPDNLGIVFADENGKAKGNFVSKAMSNENYPSLDPTAQFVTYTINVGEQPSYALGLSRRNKDDSFDLVSISATLLSDTPIRTAWIDPDKIVAGVCDGESCNIFVYSDSWLKPNPLVKINNATALGNIVYRPA